MSKQNIMGLINRLENLADALYGASFEEANSLIGQIEGTVQSINDGFRSHGISPAIPELGDKGYCEYGPENIHEAIRIFQHAAARYRGMIGSI